MLIPESGASRTIHVATRAPAQSPVKRASRAVFETVRTTDMSANEIRASAAKAATAPHTPGTVVT